MTEIRDFFVNLFISRQTPTLPAAKGGAAAEPARDERTFRDTVKLSEGGQKIVNLARGQELAKEIRTAPLDKDFSANLFKAREDIIRITRLFTETFKAAFLEGRRKG
jgi:hypothetical protein